MSDVSGIRFTGGHRVENLAEAKIVGLVGHTTDLEMKVATAIGICLRIKLTKDRHLDALTNIATKAEADKLISGITRIRDVIWPPETPT